MKKNKNKVFCIGWHKTGTTTLGLALIRLGYSVVGCRLDMVHPLRRGDIQSVIEVAEKFDAAQDVPWACLFKELDQRYPESKFIFTRRDEDSWLRSASRHFGSAYVPLHEWIYGHGRLAGNERQYLARFRLHEQEVMDYFSDRSDDLLVMDFERGDGWERLCGFLGAPRPSSRFPHENKAPEKRRVRERLVDGVRRTLPASVLKGIFAARMRIRRARGLPDPRNRFHNFHENRRERQAATRQEGPKK